MTMPRKTKDKNAFAFAIMDACEEQGVIDELYSFVAERKGSGRTFFQLLADFRKKRKIPEGLLKEKFEENLRRAYEC